jgi:hypothetical protein
MSLITPAAEPGDQAEHGISEQVQPAAAGRRPAEHGVGEHAGQVQDGVDRLDSHALTVLSESGLGR